MNDLETRLRELKLKTPSSNLDDRILRERDSIKGNFQCLRQSVSLGWAVGFAVAAAVVGYWAGSQSNQPPPQFDFGQLGVKEVHFILDESESRVFDFSVKDEQHNIYNADVQYSIQGDI